MRLTNDRNQTAPNDGQEHKEGFPGLVDWIALMDSDNIDMIEFPVFVEILKVHYKVVVSTIQNAIKIIDEVQML